MLNIGAAAGLQDYEVQQQQSNESEHTSAGCCIHAHCVEWIQQLLQH